MDFGNTKYIPAGVPDITPQFHKFEPPKFDPIKYEDTFFKEQADDVVNQISAQYGPQIEALNAIAKGTSKQADATDKQVEILKQQLELAISNAESAKKSAKFSKRMSVGAMLISIASIAANVLIKIFLG
jgi:hypothetical protein